jgi:hypothetical protein
LMTELSCRLLAVLVAAAPLLTPLLLWELFGVDGCGGRSW